MAENLTPEQQIEALSKQVTDLETKSAQKDATIAEQKGQLKTQGADLAKVNKERDQAVTERDKVTKERDQAVVDRDKAKKDLGDKVGLIRQLELDAEANETVIAGHEARERAAQVAAEGGTTVVTHEGQLYRVLVPQFHFAGQLVKAVDLKNNADVVAQLVETRSGVLEAVEA